MPKFVAVSERQSEACSMLLTLCCLKVTNPELARDEQDQDEDLKKHREWESKQYVQTNRTGDNQVTMDESLRERGRGGRRGEDRPRKGRDRQRQIARRGRGTVGGSVTE
eukprot:765307-Hanusia_phi.AAC.10